MGSSYFYMEFLLAWVTLLKGVGYRNPSLFSLEYTLVPLAVYPTQLRQALAGYRYLLSVVEDPTRVCVAGDSAGATLILSLLLCIADLSEFTGRLPGFAVMISPWVVIVSDGKRDTASDYLNSKSLHMYGYRYIGSRDSINDALASPGQCRDQSIWRKASPAKGWLFLYGSDEVLGPETRNLISLLKDTGIQVDVEGEHGCVHAWPIAALFLGENREERLKGLQDIVNIISRRLSQNVLN